MSTTDKNAKSLLILVGVISAIGLMALTGGNKSSTAVQTEAQAKYEADLNKQHDRVPPPQTSLAWEYSPEPPQKWLDVCIANGHAMNLKAQALTHSLNLQYSHLKPLPDPSLPPRATCLEIWQSWEVQQQYHIDPVYGKNGPKFAT